jgi:hypothetical protein
LLQDLIDDSLAIFPVAAIIWYASQPEMRTKPGIRELVTYFCHAMEERLHPLSSTEKKIRGHKKDSTVYRLSKAIMSGEYAWLEEGIVPLLKK